MAVANIVEVQDKILEIAVYFDKFCRQHGIAYYLMGGSALGAIRHKGFIPWDDDLDVFMTYENYQKFLRIAKKELDTKNYYLQEENTPGWSMYYTKLRMNNTTYIEKGVKDMGSHSGFFIDIMCLNNTSSCGVFRYLQYVAARLLTADGLYRKGYISHGVKKMGIAMVHFLLFKWVQVGLLKFVRAWNRKDTFYVGHFFGKAKYKNTYFPKSYLGIARYVDFNTTQLPVLEHVEEYLERRFGDYMKLPDVKEQEAAVHAQYVDLHRDYTEYLKGDK